MINVFFLKDSGGHKVGDQAFIPRAVASGLILGGVCECYSDHLDRVTAEAEAEVEKEALKPKPKPQPPAPKPEPKPQRKKRAEKKTKSTLTTKELKNG